MNHNYKKLLPALLALLLLSTFSACNNDDSLGGSDDDGPAEPEVEFATDGYLVTSQSTGDVVTTFVGYFEEEPTGNIDLVANSASFSFFRVQGVKDGFIYTTATGEDPGLIKFGINKETKALVNVGEIGLEANPGRIVFLDDGRAVMGSFTQGEIVIFDPEEMVILGRVNMSQATSIEANSQNYFTSLIYNELTDKIYAVLYTDDENTAQFYDADQIYVEVIDANTLQWEKTIVHPEAEYGLLRGEPNRVVDEFGNTYLIAQGQYGLDNNLGPTAPVGSRPQILKITANSEFDLDYAFNPIDVLGFQNNFFQLFVSMIYAGNNKAYGIGTSRTDDPAILALIQKFATVGLTDDEFNELRTLVFNGEDMSILEVDLITKEVRELPGSPLTAGFGYPYLYNYNGRFFAQVSGNGAGFSGFFEIDPQTGAVSEAFNLSTGGFAFQYMDIAAGF